MARVTGMNVGALKVAVAEGWQQLAEERLGPEIREDAKRYCPERTGALKDSISDSFDEGEQVLIVEATGGDQGREYAAYRRRARAPRLPSLDPRCRAGSGPPKSVPTPCAIYGARRVISGKLFGKTQRPRRCSNTVIRGLTQTGLRYGQSYGRARRGSLRAQR